MRATSARLTALGSHVLAALATLAAVGLAAAAGAQTPGVAERPNVLFIAVDDLGPDIGALGETHASTPHLDTLARSGRLFTRHFVQVPTCGASRAALLRGLYPTEPAHLGNAAIRDTQAAWASRSLPAYFRSQGYRTLALGKITHYPGGRTGKDWADGPEELPGVWDRAWIPRGPWTSPQAMMHGYAWGLPRRPGQSLPFEIHDGPDTAYPDAWVAGEAEQTLRDLAGCRQPWFLAVGLFKPHLPFAVPRAWFDLHAAGVSDLAPGVATRPDWPTGWHESTELLQNYGNAGRDPRADADYARLLRRARAASVSYVDAQLGRILAALRATGLEDRTIVVVWGDNGFLLGEHGVWGKHCLYERAVHTPLIVRHPGLTRPGVASPAVVESVDVFPTLAELCGLPVPAGLDGRSLGPQLRDPAAPSTKPALGFWSDGERTVRTDRWRLVTKAGSPGTAARIELFDYQADPYETRNHAAAHPGVVADLLERLGRR